MDETKKTTDDITAPMQNVESSQTQIPQPSFNYGYLIYIIVVTILLGIGFGAYTEGKILDAQNEMNIDKARQISSIQNLVDMFKGELDKQQNLTAELIIDNQVLREQLKNSNVTPITKEQTKELLYTLQKAENVSIQINTELQNLTTKQKNRYCRTLAGNMFCYTVGHGASSGGTSGTIS